MKLAVRKLEQHYPSIIIFTGVTVLILTMPVNSLIWNVMRSYQKKQMSFKDIRINLINEILGGIKVIKLYAWEKSFMDKITEIRY